MPIRKNEHDSSLDKIEELIHFSCSKYNNTSGSKNKNKSENKCEIIKSKIWRITESEICILDHERDMKIYQHHILGTLVH